MALKLTYFPVMAKGLSPALCLEHSGLEWDGEHKKGGEWMAMKPSTPFGQLPVLEVPGYGMLAQSVAIINFVAYRAPALQGAGAEEYATSQMLIHETEDIYGLLAKYQDTVFAKDKCPKEETEKIWAETIPTHLKQLEALMQRLGKDGAYTSSGLTCGELHLFSTLHQLKLVKGDCLEATPGVAKFYARVAADPKTKHVLETGSKMKEPFVQYFIPRP
eukprot:TRINITY_DN3393_c0_g2_i3.p1 TRINITY_DN3393_c0_g2~~TRINITY_DN3393_c0_g2_i3.p1  ORF type:complete len:249 (+),score=106.01 TRINITY_DN3393_c0_g2_i3:96-749(+)